jgi:hypothetical protein
MDLAMYYVADHNAVAVVAVCVVPMLSMSTIVKKKEKKGNFG